MRITCRNCGGDHPVWECKRPATKLTAARPVRRGNAGTETSREQVQILPVDTNPGAEDRVSPCPTSSVATAPNRRAGDKDDQPIPKRKVGRPKFITDLKAYKAMKQKEYRRKWKERGNA